MDNVLLAKFANLERCLKRIKEEYAACQGNIEEDILRQDSIILNLQRACEQCLDMGQRIVRLKKLGLPNRYREVFQLLAQANIIEKDLAQRLELMVGFRNIAIHEYQEISLEKVHHIVETGIQDLSDFGQKLLYLM